jgi:hypothetical protein
VSEVDPDPNLPDEGAGGTELGGRPEPRDGDPTDGGKRGEIGEAPSIASDEPSDGSTYAPGGGRVTEETNAPPVADPGPDA